MEKIAVIGNRIEAKNQNYIDVVEALGFTPVVIFPEDGTDLIRAVYGVILPGGGDLNPELYHEENTLSEDIDDRLDAFEFDVIEKALRYQKPILGICRGLQALNVYFGGSLIQNIERIDIHTREQEADKVHATKVEKDSFLYRLYGSERISVNSAHHQAVKELGKGLVTVQYSEDGIVEGICHKEYPIYAVQWHPERMCLKHQREDTVDGFRFFELLRNER